MGRHEMSSAVLMDTRDPRKGVVVTYSGGHVCSSVERMMFNEPRKAVFRLVCASEGEGEWREVEMFPFDLAGCEIVLEKRTKAGCPLNYVPRSAAGRIWLM